MIRIAAANHSQVPTGIIIEKTDINPGVAGRIEKYAATTRRDVLGRICYDPAFTRAQLSGSSVLQAASADLRLCLESVWRAVERAVQKQRSPFAVIQ